MEGKITLITPPDFFENLNLSILLLHISEEQQQTISEWLNRSNYKGNINLYFYTNETNMAWLLYALNRCQYTFINFNNMNLITQSMGSYFLARNGVYFTSDNEDLVSIYSHISSNRVLKIENFLERIISE